MREQARMAQAFVGLGANLGDPAGQIACALEALAALPRTRLLRASSLYRTAPVGHLDQADFVNAVALIETALDPRELLDGLLAIEHAEGRERSFRNAPRRLDLDLLLYDTQVIEAPGLAVPHPRMHERAFVLVPLLEIAPDASIPRHGRAADLLDALAVQEVHRLAPA
jgi:2-amino-4-hydroxy-6-hydroxymethyldihydropteridine diphosphokinase